MFEKEENFFNDLFENIEKEQNEENYKKNLYVLKEDLNEKNNENSIKFMHDVLLSKLMLEDYSEFSLKNNKNCRKNSINNNNTLNNNKEISNENKIEEEEYEKILEEENEFLNDLNKINYLTFSPFALSFFDENSNLNKIVDNNENLFDNNNNEKKENEILKLLNFNYENFDINNDLLFNIAQGFVDINKLKEENLSINHNSKIKKESNFYNNNNNINNNEEINNEEEEIEDEEIIQENIDFVMKWIQKKKSSLMYKELINEIIVNLSRLDDDCKNSEKNNFFKETKNKIIEKEKEIFIEREMKKENERKKIEEMKKLKEIENENEIKKQIELKKEKEFEDEINEIKKLNKNKKIEKNENKKNKKNDKIKNIIEDYYNQKELKKNEKKERFNYFYKKSDYFFDDL